MAVNDINIGLFEKDFSLLYQPIGKILIVGVDTADDFSRGVLPSFLNGSCLAMILPVVPIVDHIRVSQKNFLNTVIRGRIQDGKLNLNGLAANAFQGVGEKLGMAVNGNAYTENQETVLFT